MQYRLFAIAAVLANAAFVAAAPAEALRDDVIRDSWIITLRDDAPDSVFSGFQRHFLKRSEEGHIQINYEYDTGAGSFRGFALSGPSDAIMALSESEWVENIEQDRWFSLSVDEPSEHRENGSVPVKHHTKPLDKFQWNLEHISHKGHHDPPKDSEYLCPDGCGAGTYIYIIDSGVSPHSEFEGRLEEGLNLCEDKYDLDGHGTHVAGIAAGRNRGVAQNAQVISVKVFCHNGAGSGADVVKGVTWAINDVVSKGRTGKAVFNLSFGGKRRGLPGTRDVIMKVVAKAYEAGIFVAVAAGNQGINAFNTSPAAEPAACTAGGINEDGEFYRGTNWGRAVDILAPAVKVWSASFRGPENITAMSGTSMAAPHVAGVAATLLGSGKNIMPHELCSQLNVMGDTLQGPIPSNTTKQMLWNGAS
ncbi:putative Peptidase S8/S53 domain-containing protein [Seiridium cardinale]